MEELLLNIYKDFMIAKSVSIERPDEINVNYSISDRTLVEMDSE